MRKLFALALAGLATMTGSVGTAEAGCRDRCDRSYRHAHAHKHSRAHHRPVYAIRTYTYVTPVYTNAYYPVSPVYYGYGHGGYRHIGMGYTVYPYSGYGYGTYDYGHGYVYGVRHHHHW